MTLATVCHIHESCSRFGIVDDRKPIPPKEQIAPNLVGVIKEHVNLVSQKPPQPMSFEDRMFHEIKMTKPGHGTVAYLEFYEAINKRYVAVRGTNRPYADYLYTYMDQLTKAEKSFRRENRLKNYQYLDKK